MVRCQDVTLPGGSKVRNCLCTLVEFFAMSVPYKAGLNTSQWESQTERAYTALAFERDLVQPTLNMEFSYMFYTRERKR